MSLFGITVSLLLCIPCIDETEVHFSDSMTQLIRAIDAQRARLEKVVLLFNETIYAGEGAPPQSVEELIPENMNSSADYELILRNNMYSLKQTVINQEINQADTVGPITTWTWDGYQGRTISIKAIVKELSLDPLPVDIVIVRQYHSKFMFGFSRSEWLGINCLGLDHWENLADLLRLENLSVVYKVLDNGRLKWRIEPQTLPKIFQVDIIAKQRQGTLEIEELVIYYGARYFGKSEDSNRNANRRTYKYGPTRMEDGEPVPSSAYILSQSEGGKLEKAVWEIRVINQVSAVPISTSQETFRPSLPEHARIWDSRYRIGYEIGSNRINVDGRTLDASTPVLGEIDPHRLVEIIANGKWIDFSHIHNNNLQQDSSVWSRFLFISCIVSALALLVIPKRIFRKKVM